LKPFAGRATAVYGVPIAGHESYAPVAIKASAEAVGVPGLFADDVKDALKTIARTSDAARPPVVLICGSLYLAGTVLEQSGIIPA
jgi:dihydrofolate synthase / folylpolyglutamate synthase